MLSPASSTHWLQLLLLAGTLAGVPMGWWWLKRRHEQPRERLAALTLLTLFLTFDLIAFGAFTRLTDSGLGCPDWPGCYGQSTPLTAQADIHSAEAGMPSGPVTWRKAWIEMLHRYLAMVVGALILAISALSWRHRHVLPHAMTWPAFTLFWVVLQGLFGKYTVTWKLYPAIVSLHLLGAMILLALLVVQHRAFSGRHWGLSVRQRLAGMAVLGLLLVQVALGAWVSTNYAVLACQSFPKCQAHAWWPEADWSQGFTLLRELGRDAQGGYITSQALVAIHLAHRAFALLAAAGMAAFAWVLRRHASPAVQSHARWLLALLLLQVTTGTANVVLGWPLLGALCHTAGAAALVGVLVSLVVAMPSSGQPGSA